MTASPKRIYEYRRYTAMPGKLPELRHRLENVASRMWNKHGIRNIAFWETVVGGDSNAIHYILEWDDMAHRQRAWEAFTTDPEWLAARAATENNGPLVEVIHNEFWRSTSVPQVPT